jgi:hypothetical protein
MSGKPQKSGRTKSLLRRRIWAARFGLVYAKRKKSRKVNKPKAALARLRVPGSLAYIMLDST